MTKNNSVFLWKIPNYSSGRPNLRIDMNQVTNLKSLASTWKKIANLVGVFSEIALWDIDFRGFFDVAFDPHHLFCSRPCCKTGIICISCWSRWFTSTNPKKLSALPVLPPPFVLGKVIPNSCVADVCWLQSFSPFAMFVKPINNCTISFKRFSVLVIQE